VYGVSKAWSDVLRTHPNGSLVPFGLLASENDDGFFPATNHVRLPLANPPPPAFHSKYTKMDETEKVDRFYGICSCTSEHHFVYFSSIRFRFGNILTYGI